MKTLFVIREHDNVIVSIMKNKNDGTYSFVNLTKGHICPCRFKTIDDAMLDLYNQQLKGKIISYYDLLAFNN